jgi:ABC-2 type transport system permease protein
MRTLRIILLFFRVNLLNELAYRVNLFLQCIDCTAQLGTSLAWIWVAVTHTQSVNGWSGLELVALVGIFQIVGGVVKMVIQPSLWRLMDEIQQGQFDYLLLKPVDAQLHSSVREIRIARTVDIVLGGATVAIALMKGAGSQTLLGSAGFLLVFPCGVLIVYSIMFTLASTAFWFVRVDNVVYIFMALFQAGRWPVDIYPRYFRGMLTFVIPVAFAVTIPAEALAGRLGPATMAISFGLAVGFFGLSRLVWNVGLGRYSGASA